MTMASTDGLEGISFPEHGETSFLVGATSQDAADQSFCFFSIGAVAARLPTWSSPGTLFPHWLPAGWASGSTGAILGDPSNCGEEGATLAVRPCPEAPASVLAAAFCWGDSLPLTHATPR